MKSARSVSLRPSFDAIRALSALTLVAAAGCASTPSKRPGDTEGPLECTPASPCLPLEQEIAAQCGGSATVQRGMLGGYTVLTIATDPQSYVYTSFSNYYDATGRLVGRSRFVSEYAMHSREGIVPVGSPIGMVSACSPR